MILKVVEQPAREGGDEPDGKQSDTRVFMVKTDSKLTTRREVLSHYKIPQWGTPWNVGYLDLNMLAKKRTAVMDSRSPYHWRVTVNYLPREKEDDEERNPILRLPKFNFGTYEESLVLAEDLDGNKFDNTAGEPLEEAPEWVRNYRMVTMTRNEPAFSFSLDAYMDTVCSHGLFGKPAKTWRMGAITATGPEFDAEVEVYYYTVVYQMYFNPDGWTKKLRNCGYRIKKTIGGDVKILPATDDDGLTFSSPIDLNADGDKLAPDADVIYLDRRGYNFKSWTALKLEG